MTPAQYKAMDVEAGPDVGDEDTHTH